jgi:hypothetical protein
MWLMPISIQMAMVTRIAIVTEECGIDDIYSDLREYKCDIYDNVTTIVKDRVARICLN